MAWTGFNIYGTYYSLSHLNEHTIFHSIDGQTVEITIEYGSHCFSDKKGNGPMIFRNANRYWSQERYEDSKMLPSIVTGKLLTEYVVPYLRDGNEQYYYLEDGYYAVFCSITKPANTVNKIRIYVISAYDKTGISRENNKLPSGSPLKTSWVISQKLSNP